MVVTLELKPEIQAQIVAQASAQGMPLELYLQSLIEGLVNGQEEKPLYETANNDEWEREFQSWADSHLDIVAGPADDSRESIYRDREDSQL